MVVKDVARVKVLVANWMTGEISLEVQREGIANGAS